MLLNPGKGAEGREGILIQWAERALTPWQAEGLQAAYVMVHTVCLEQGAY